MKALRFVDKQECRVEDVDVPPIGADEVLVALRSVGICHSDVELLAGRYIIPFSYPLIPGHEWAGQIVESGRDVTGLVAGDRVIGECVIGQDHFGFSISGAAAEYFVAKPSWLHRLPDALTWTQGALVEPFSCGYHATQRADNVNASDTVLVFGAGPIGLGVVAASVALGARVLVAEPSAERAALAVRLGADGVIDPTTDTFVDAVREATWGRGADVVFEASGKPPAMAAAFDIAAHRARLVFIGIDVGSRPPVPLGMIQSKELQLRGIIGSPGVWPQTLRFLERSQIDLSPIVTSTYRIEDAAKALDAVMGDPTQIKVHITSDADR
jgi:L-iditol 2-dehydrogenase